MNIQIENYFGNDIMKLDYCQKDKVISKERISEVEGITKEFGYNVSDVDVDENGIDYIRVQEVNVDNSEEQGHKDLLSMINKLNETYL